MGRLSNAEKARRAAEQAEFEKRMAEMDARKKAIEEKKSTLC